MAEPKITDAEYKVVHGPKRPGGWWFDWRNFLIVGGLGLVGAIRALIETQ